MRLLGSCNFMTKHVNQNINCEELIINNKNKM